MRRLLGKLDVETFVLDTGELPAALPDIAGITLRRIDAQTLEAEMARGHDLNSLFAALTAHGIAVTSMRTKTNRLEELFVRLVDNGKAHAA
jgi:ABC-2 type transport system ATP-binding protein